MIDHSESWLNDDAPRLHKFVRIIFFLTSFSWTLNPIQDYMGESTPIEKIVTRMIPMAIVAVYCFTCSYRDKIKRIFRPGMWPLLWYVGFGVFSGMASLQPALSAWKGFEIIIAIMFISVSCRDVKSTQMEFGAYIRYFEILLWVTVALAIINPALGLRRSMSMIPWLQGYLPIINPNALGFLSVLVITALLILPVRYKPIRLAMAAGTLLCSQSRTSYAVTFVILVIYCFDGFRTRQFGRVVMSLGFAIIAIAFFAGFHENILKVVMRGQTSEEMSTLSGRTDYWDFALRYVTWQGGGFGSGSRSLIFLNDDVFHKGSVNMHNSYIEALMGGGYVGAIPFLAMIIINIARQGVNTVVVTNRSELIFFVCAVTMIARGMTSVVLALFSFDFNNMMILWAWLYVRTLNSKPALPYQKPKPVVYTKTLHEQALEKTA